MAAPLQPNAFQYVSDSHMRGVFALFTAVGVLLSGSLITGVFGLAGLAQAHWLQKGDLPYGTPAFWGVTLLCIATVQGLAAILLLFARRAGIVLGVALCVINIYALVSLIAPYPIWSVVGIGASLTGIYVLLGIVLPALPHQHRHGH